MRPVVPKIAKELQQSLKRPRGKTLRLTDIDLRHVETLLAQRSLSDFVRMAWRIVEPQTELLWGWHIEAICQHLEAVTRGQIRDLLILIPPRCMKSTLVSVMWPAWVWGPAGMPHIRWLFAAYAESLSIRDSVRTRRLIQSKWYQERWSWVFKLTGDQNAKQRFENDKGGYRLATSVGGAATGEGGDVIVCDDPHNLQQAESDVMRKAVCDWWDQVMSTRRNSRHSARVIIMQRCHELDLAGHVVERGGWEVLVLPMEFEPERRCRTSIGFVDPRQEEGELLWPEAFPRATVESLKRDLGAYAYAAQMQQRPAPLAGGIVRRTWWRYYDQPPERFDEIVQSWDMAFKDAEGSSYVVGGVWGRLGADKYLLDMVRGHWNFVETVDAVERLVRRWPQTMAIYVEDKANGPAVISTLRGKIGGIVAVQPQGTKLARAQAVSPQIEAGNVYLPRTEAAPWVQDFIEEWTVFPNGRHDDIVDMTTQALLRLEASARLQRQLTTLPPIVSDVRANPMW